jgi:hypothetical protein
LLALRDDDEHHFYKHTTDYEAERHAAPSHMTSVNVRLLSDIYSCPPTTIIDQRNNGGEKGIMPLTRVKVAGSLDAASLA